jgi:hypothetical protein
MKLYHNIRWEISSRIFGYQIKRFLNSRGHYFPGMPLKLYTECFVWWKLDPEGYTKEWERREVNVSPDTAVSC